MVKTWNVGTYPGTDFGSSANTTQYWMMAAGLFAQASATETQMQVLWRSAGTASNLYVRLHSNTIAGTTTFTLRKNAADTAMVISVGASASGHFTDSNTVSIAAGDKLCVKSVPGAAPNTLCYRIDH
jgi:hypothetical protein